MSSKKFRNYTLTHHWPELGLYMHAHVAAVPNTNDLTVNFTSSRPLPNEDVLNSLIEKSFPQLCAALAHMALECSAPNSRKGNAVPRQPN